MYPDLKYWVWLTIAYGPANARKWNFVSHYASVKHAYECVLSGDFRYVLPQDIRNVQSASLSMAEKLIEYCIKNGISIYCFDDEHYPKRLHEIYNPPSVLFVRGNIDGIDDSVVIAAVGTRRPSEYSVSVSTKIIKELSIAGVMITSGFADGLDTLALMTCHSSGGRAIACLPCGLNRDYPKDSARNRAVLCEGGAVISEFFPDDGLSAASFRARNRVISGISLGTVILQAGEGSGALSTASFAVAQGKDLFCVPPHELYNSAYSGVIHLLRDGAIPVFDARDILNEYYSVYAHRLNFSSDIYGPKSEHGLFAEPDESKPLKAVKASEKKAIRRIDKANTVKQDIIDLPENKRHIIEYIEKNVVVVFDEIAAEFPCEQELDVILSEMELEGLIQSLSGNRYTISK